MKKGISNFNVRIENRKKLTEMLYWGNGMSKQDIAINMELSMPTVNLLVSQLEEEGFISKCKAAASSGGRIPELLHFRYDAKLTVGVEIALDYCKVLIADMRGLQKACKVVAAKYNDGITYWLGVRAIILQVLREYNLKEEKVIGIGVALSETVERFIRTKLQRFEGNVRQEYEEKLKKLLGRPVLLEQDTNAAAFANVWHDRESNDLVYLSVSKNVDAAMASKQHIVYGKNGRYGAIGHMCLRPGGKTCSCGRQGCVQAYCSTSVLTSAFETSLEDFFLLVKQSAVAQQLWTEYLLSLATLIANINMMVDAPVIIGGELGKHYANFEKDLNGMLQNKTPFYSAGMIMPASVHENAPAIGASLLVAAKHLELISEE